MNGPPPDGNQNAIDIFVVSSHETLAPVLREHLEQNGYHVTLFDDDRHLIETLKTGKPNLLICDATDHEEESYELCRQIKADRDLFVIPVLVLTRGTDLADLLHVLDCNADNFISFPYDLPYLGSLITGMLGTPVERPTPEQIKTQFKIQHNDQIFVVTADRRKLLEFLLSSFEIAISRQEEIADAKERIHLLEETVDKLESDAQETKRDVRALNDRLEERDKAIVAFRAEVSEKNRFIETKSREIASLKTELEKNLGLLVKAEESLEIATRKSDEAAHSYETALKSVEERAAALTAEVDTLTQELGGAKETIRNISELHAAAETSLADLRLQKDETDKALVARTQEYNEMNATCNRERDRAVAAEAKTQQIIASKMEMEGSLRRIIGEQEAVIRQKESDITAYQTTVSEAETREEQLNAKIRSQDQELQSERIEAEKNRTLLASQTDLAAGQEREIHEIKEQIRQKDTDIAKFRTMLDETEARCSSLNVQIDSLKTGIECERSESAKKIDELLGKLAGIEVQFSAAAAKAEETEALLKTRDMDCAAAHLELERSREMIRTLTADLEDVREALSDEKLLGKSREEENRSLAEENHRIAAQEASASRLLEEVRSTLSAEREQARASEERLNGIIRDQTAMIESFRGAHSDLRDDHDRHKSDLLQARAGLEAAAKEQARLERAVSEAQEKLRLQERELKEVSANSTWSGQQVRSLSDELGQTRADLETERRLRRVAEESLKSALAAHERSGQEIGRLVTATGSLDAAIDAERKLRLETERAAEKIRDDLAIARKKLAEAEQKSETLAKEQTRQSSALSGEIETSRQKILMLEEQIETLKKEKMAVEQTMSSLSLEIEQARKALADEWGDHMSEHEQLVQARSALADEWEDHMEVTEELHNARSALADEWEDHMEAQEILTQAAVEREQQTESPAIVVKSLELPATIPPAAPPMVIPEETHETPHISGVEDLFEDVVEENRDEETPAPASPSAVESQQIVVNDTGDEQGDTEATFDEDGQSDPSEDNYEDAGDTGTEPPVIEEKLPIQNRMQNAQPGISFNRSQWFDLLRWSHHSGALTQEQRMQIVRMGRLIQRGRRLTPKQEEQVVEMITLAQALGYRFIS